jgi:toxin ParE1/3/4
MIVRFTREADTDLETMGDYIARDDWQRAVTFVEELRAACADLATSSALYPLVARHSSRGLRRRPYGRYLIFFRTVAGEVRIIRILHGARDYGVILFPA